MARQRRAELLLCRATNARKYSRGDCPERCRERRHRRIQMRRLTPCSSGHNETPMSDKYISLHNRKRPQFMEAEEEEEGEEEEENTNDKPVEELSPPPRLQNPMPVSSTIAMREFAGRMDGKLCVKEDFCRLEFVGGEPLHFFAVYDGDASGLYKELMHHFIAEELTRVDRHSSLSSRSRRWLEDHLRTALRRSFERMDQVVAGPCRCIENGYPCACNPICRLAFERSAATVAVLTAELIVVAHCGVSSAVLCRGGIPIPLSHDHHKVFSRRYVSRRKSEPERICGVSERIIPYCNGVRKYGILDMSRLGNRVVRSSAVASQPEISITERRVEDECLILASYGIWEVISNNTACHIATTCLRDENSTNSSNVPLGEFNNKFRHDQILLDEEVFSSKSSNIDAAALLCRLALGRGSSDNMSAIVVDFKRHLPLERQN
ncbi:putative protein phosphatase 2C 75 [Morus notabilis]|uniref:PPM-type phosphatase domain-containing protein n=1 Tax=Morus notabilis TaxID=981085 RepID=W9SQJ8_9ROSA|nr:putative protein phosphatase 2C 75 [Morus notabilis]